MNENLALWDAVSETDPEYTKKFVKGGGFGGTSPSPMWLIKQATSRWGPMGGKWGLRIIEQAVLKGAPLVVGGEAIGHTKVHTVLAELFYPLAEGGQGTVPCFGQTMLVSQLKDGRIYTDEDAPKKSLTDALKKGLSWLGFASDIFMGLYDDDKYVAAVADKFAEKAAIDATADAKAQHASAMKTLDEAACNGNAALNTAWKLLSEKSRELCSKDKRALRTIREKANKMEESDRAALDLEPTV